jgi:hypothetical protein
MKTTVKKLRKTIMLGGMSVEEAAEWCERSVRLNETTGWGWFEVLIRHLLESEGRNPEFVYYPDEDEEDGDPDDYFLELPDCDGLLTLHYGSESYGDTEDAASTDCDTLNEFIRDFCK